MNALRPPWLMSLPVEWKEHRAPLIRASSRIGISTSKRFHRRCALAPELVVGIGLEVTFFDATEKLIPLGASFLQHSWIVPMIDRRFSQNLLYSGGRFQTPHDQNAHFLEEFIPAGGSGLSRDLFGTPMLSKL